MRILRPNLLYQMYLMSSKSLQALLSVALAAPRTYSSSICWTIGGGVKLGQQDVKQEAGNFNWTWRRGISGQSYFDRKRDEYCEKSNPRKETFRRFSRDSFLDLKSKFLSFFKKKMIVYSKITADDTASVATHMLKGFYLNEPFGLALGLTMDQVESWFPQFLNEVLNYYEPVSFMAKDEETGEIVGVILNIMMEENRSPPPSMKQYLDKQKQPVKWQIVTFLEDLENGVDPVKELKLDASKENLNLVCLFVSVLPEYGGKGIAKTLIKQSEEDVKKNLKNVTIAMTDVTSQFSYLAFQKQGYYPMKEVKYLDYKDPDGIPIFQGREKQLGVHTHARVMIKKL